MEIDMKLGDKVKAKKGQFKNKAGTILWKNVSSTDFEVEFEDKHGNKTIVPLLLKEIKPA
jgi:transcription antitermination factor NusG